MDYKTSDHYSYTTIMRNEKTFCKQTLSLMIDDKFSTGTALYNTDVHCVGFHSSNITNVNVYMHASNMVSNLDVFFVVAVK